LLTQGCNRVLERGQSARQQGAGVGRYVIRHVRRQVVRHVAQQAVHRHQDADRSIIATLATPVIALHETLGAGPGDAAELGQFIVGHPPAVARHIVRRVA
jgi:hypothetical protein